MFEGLSDGAQVTPIHRRVLLCGAHRAHSATYDEVFERSTAPHVDEPRDICPII